MSFGFGAAGHIGWGLESSGGVAVAATDYVQGLSETLALTIDRFDIVNIAGRLAEPDDKDGVRRIAGDVVFAAAPEALGFFLFGSMGVDVVTEVLSGFLYQHDFTMRTGDFDNRFPQHPFTFEIFRDVDSAQQYDGVNMTSIAFNAVPNQDVRITTSMIGTNTRNIDETTPSFVNSPACPFAFDTASISIAGADSALLESFTLNIDSLLEGIPTLNNSEIIAKIRRTNFQQIRINADIGFEDIVEYQNFVNQTEQTFTVSFTRGDSFQLIFDIPRVIYTAFPLSIGGRDRQVVTIDGTARFDTGSNNAITVRLTNTTSFYA